MDKSLPSDSSILVRSAEYMGRALGDWRRRRVAAAQDAYIEVWKNAWTEGCHAGWDGQALTTVPYKTAPRSDAWKAGWNWASMQPDRRGSARPTNEGFERRRTDARSKHLE